MQDAKTSFGVPKERALWSFYFCYTNTRGDFNEKAISAYSCSSTQASLLQKFQLKPYKLIDTTACALFRCLTYFYCCLVILINSTAGHNQPFIVFILSLCSTVYTDNNTHLRIKTQSFLAIQIQFAYQKFIAIIIYSADKWVHEDLLFILQPFAANT